MISALTLHASVARRFAETAALPSGAQEETLVALLDSLDRAELAPFVALLIGEVVALRARGAARSSHPSSPQPSPAATSPA